MRRAKAYRYKSSGKYNAKKTVIDGITFDSKKEASRYQELKLMEKAGAIMNLELQPRFLLQDKYIYQGKTVRKIEYIADFRYKDTKTGKTIVEDVKGVKTDIYKLKKKLFLCRYGQLLEFNEI